MSSKYVAIEEYESLYFILGGIVFFIFFALLLMIFVPYNTLPNPSQKEAALIRCNQLHGQLEMQTSGYGGDIRNINCITPTGYYSLFKSEEVRFWDDRYLHPKNGEIFN
jgi:hypothetical protein